MTSKPEQISSDHRDSAKTGILVIIIAILILIADQTMKIWVKTHFYLGEDLPITSWWHLKFIENNGMAFGMELASKYLLTFGRIAAVAVMIWMTVKCLRNANLRTGFYVAMALIMAGAAGNIFDCVLYGVLFSNPWPPMIAQWMPEGGGYAPLFQGMVVDMMYFPLFTFTWPEWIPGVGGTEYEFFQYIFNIADAAICVGVFLMILFFSKDANQAINIFLTKTPKAPKLK